MRAASARNGVTYEPRAEEQFAVGTRDALPAATDRERTWARELMDRKVDSFAAVAPAGQSAASYTTNMDATLGGSVEATVAFLVRQVFPTHQYRAGRAADLARSIRQQWPRQLWIRTHRQRRMNDPLLPQGKPRFNKSCFVTSTRHTYGRMIFPH